MPPHLKLVSINIERSNHLDRVHAFLEHHVPDVVCLQELMEHDIPYFENVCGGGHCIFSPMTHYLAQDRLGVMGMGIFSRLPISKNEARYYLGSHDAIVDFDPTNAETKHTTEAYAVIFCDIEKDGHTFRIATTHFTWTPNGAPDDFQRADLQGLLAVLETLGEFVLCGDFNAPRMYQGASGEIFSAIAARYKDNIPLQYETSIDVSLHHNGTLHPQELADKMVDGVFSTSDYAVSDVELVSGVSDHCAVVATISSII